MLKPVQERALIDAAIVILLGLHLTGLLCSYAATQHQPRCKANPEDPARACHICP